MHGTKEARLWTIHGGRGDRLKRHRLVGLLHGCACGCSSSGSDAGIGEHLLFLFLHLQVHGACVGRWWRRGFDQRLQLLATLSVLHNFHAHKIFRGRDKPEFVGIDLDAMLIVDELAARAKSARSVLVVILAELRLVLYIEVSWSELTNAVSKLAAQAILAVAVVKVRAADFSFVCASGKQFALSAWCKAFVYVVAS